MLAFKFLQLFEIVAEKLVRGRGFEPLRSFEH